MRTFFKKRKQISVAILFLLFFQIFSGVLYKYPAYADSNDTRKLMLDMAKNKSSVDLKATDLSEKELQAIGIFLSNLYEPFVTKIGQPDSEASKETIDNMVDSLVDCNFNKEVAKDIVETIFSISVTSYKELNIYDYDDGVLGDARTEDGASYYDFVRYFSGIPFVGNEFCLAWDKNVVLDSRLDTASAQALTMMANGIDYESGYGSSVTNSESKSKKIGDDMDASSFEGSKLVTEWKMYVDAFGNILTDNGAYIYVVVPACINPYTWKVKDSEAGSKLPLVNLMSLANTSDAKYEFKSGKSKLNITKSDNKYNIYVDTSKSIFTLPAWRIFMGIKTDDYDSPQTIKDGSNTDMTFNSTKLWEKLPAINIFHKPGDRNLIEQLADENMVLPHPSNKGYTFPAWKRYMGYSSKTWSQSDVIDSMIMFDDLGTFQNASEVTPDIFKKSENGIFNSGNKSLVPDSKVLGGSSVNSLHNINSLARSENSKLFMVNIYVTYVLAYFDDSNEYVNFNINKEGLPEITGTGNLFDGLTENSTTDHQAEQIKGMIYYLLSPTEGARYVSQLIKYKVTAVLSSTHEDIVGVGNNVNAGVTRYLGFSGYVTIPEMSDLEWTSYMINSYMVIYIYLILGIAIILLCYVIVGNLSFQKAIIGICVFSVCAYFPPVLIDTTISKSNAITSKIYSQKFTYWALVQHQSYLSDIESASNSGSYSDYLSTLLASKVDEGYTDSTAIKLKWMSPKKTNEMAKEEEALEKITNSSTLGKLLSQMASGSYSGETFLDNSEATYLYRSYTDIDNHSRALYNNLNVSKVTSTTSIPSMIDLSIGNYEKELATSQGRGFNLKPKVVSVGSDTFELETRWKAILSSSDLESILETNIDDLSYGSYAGLPQVTANYTVADLNTSTTSNSQLPKAGLYTFEQFTESPYYFFSWNMYDLGMSSNMGVQDGFKNIILKGKTGHEGNAFFYNLEAEDSSYGEMRDYLDMRSLFTTVIPTLKKANNIVNDWNALYGLELYKGIGYTPEDKPQDGTDEDLYKHWHNVNVAQLWNIYSPWVDTMYDCAYAKPETIYVTGDKFRVKDPLNPNSYPGEDKGRPMIFSKSEMEYWGLKESDLTQAELKILKVEDSTMQDLYTLMNYYTFDDTVLATASSMLMTFNFNETFSEQSYLKGSHVMYPQAFELKNFTYDAYLRLIMSNASGESLQDTSGKSIYERIIMNSNVFTGVFMLINDCLATYVVACEKLFFILIVFFMSIVLIVSSAVRLDISISKTMWNSLICPLLKFFAISVAHAVIIACFMADGNTGVTGEKTFSISLGDPTMTILLMIFFNTVISIAYFIVCYKSFKDLFKYAKAVLTSVGGAVAGTVALGASVLMKGKRATVSTGTALRAPVDKYNRARDNYIRRKANKEMAGIHPKKRKGVLGMYDNVMENGIVDSILNINKEIKDGKNKFNEETTSSETGTSNKTKTSKSSPSSSSNTSSSSDSNSSNKETSEEKVKPKKSKENDTKEQENSKNTENNTKNKNSDNKKKFNTNSGKEASKSNNYTDSNKPNSTGERGARKNRVKARKQASHTATSTKNSFSTQTPKTTMKNSNSNAKRKKARKINKPKSNKK